MNPSNLKPKKSKKSKAQQQREVLAWLHENFYDRDTISYIKANDHFVEVYHRNGSRIEIWTSLTIMYSVLNHTMFRLVHRSHIVNLNDVKYKKPQGKGGKFIVSNKKEVPVNEVCYKKLHNRFPPAPTTSHSA